jgi:pilus assembly protein Flp/PilA
MPPEQADRSSSHRPLLVRLLADERGATALEYALVGSLVAILAIAGLQALSDSTVGLYDRLDLVQAAIGAAIGR